MALSPSTLHLIHVSFHESMCSPCPQCSPPLKEITFIFSACSIRTKADIVVIFRTLDQLKRGVSHVLNTNGTGDGLSNLFSCLVT